jgi:hypothetical protein
MGATCSFCSFARDRQIVEDKRWLGRAGFAQALPIPHRRGCCAGAAWNCRCAPSWRKGTGFRVSPALGIGAENPFSKPQTNKDHPQIVKIE